MGMYSSSFCTCGTEVRTLNGRTARNTAVAVITRKRKLESKPPDGNSRIELELAFIALFCIWFGLIANTKYSVQLAKADNNRTKSNTLYLSEKNALSDVCLQHRVGLAALRARRSCIPRLDRREFVMRRQQQYILLAPSHVFLVLFCFVCLLIRAASSRYGVKARVFEPWNVKPNKPIPMHCNHIVRYAGANVEEKTTDEGQRKNERRQMKCKERRERTLTRKSNKYTNRKKKSSLRCA